MIKRLLAIAFIFICTSIAWAVLGGTIVSRTDSSSERLRSRIQSVWGARQIQSAPVATFTVPIPDQETIQESESGKKRTVERIKLEQHSMPPKSSDIAVSLALEHRQKGLLWYSTYKVDFQGDYEFRNSTAAARKVRLVLPFPTADALYDGLVFTLNGTVAPATIESDKAWVEADLVPGQAVKLHAAYRSQGLDSWSYSFGEKVNPVENFHLRLTTNFKDIDFPDNTLAPGVKHETSNGWQLDWNYQNLLSGYQISMTLPAKLQPGPLASEISFFAPVSLFFFFFVIFILTTTRNIELHPMNYFFLAAAFFAFHLLLAYLMDHVDIYLAFGISSVVSVMLVVTYLRIVVGEKFAFREAALAQFTYLVLFSFAFFFKGFTGLAITIVAILTLFIVMQMTGRIRWQEKFAAVPPPLPFRPPM